MGAIKWIGGMLGWVLGGPIGGLVGFFLGTAVDSARTLDNGLTDGDNTSDGHGSRPQTHAGDFGVCLLVLSAAVMKADSTVKKSELNYVKTFFRQQFGQEKAEQYILILRDLLKQDYDLVRICMQIKVSMDHASRLQLLHYLFGLAQSDGEVADAEQAVIKRIAYLLGISTPDFESIQAMFVKNVDSAYTILEITPEATDDEVRKAYKKMAMKHHPDKVSHLGEDVQKQAKEKFQEIQQAYEDIKKQRGMN